MSSYALAQLLIGITADRPVDIRGTEINVWVGAVSEPSVDQALFCPICASASVPSVEQVPDQVPALSVDQALLADQVQSADRARSAGRARMEVS